MNISSNFFSKKSFTKASSFISKSFSKVSGFVSRTFTKGSGFSGAGHNFATQGTISH